MMSDEPELVDWVGLIFNRFASIEIENFFELIRISPDTDFGLARNSLDWLGLKFLFKIFTRVVYCQRIV